MLVIMLCRNNIIYKLSIVFLLNSLFTLRGWHDCVVCSGAFAAATVIIVRAVTLEHARLLHRNILKKLNRPTGP